MIEDGELLAFDTDLVGAYGMCIDMSRTWLCGDGTPTGAQADVYARARDDDRVEHPAVRAGRDVSARSPTGSRTRRSTSSTGTP